MLYEMTLEKTVRVCIKIEAEDDKEAEKRLVKFINLQMIQYFLAEM